MRLFCMGCYFTCAPETGCQITSTTTKMLRSPPSQQPTVASVRLHINIQLHLLLKEFNDLIEKTINAMQPYWTSVGSDNISTWSGNKLLSQGLSGIAAWILTLRNQFGFNKTTSISEQPLQHQGDFKDSVTSTLLTCISIHIVGPVQHSLRVH